MRFIEIINEYINEYARRTVKYKIRIDPVARPSVDLRNARQWIHGDRTRLAVNIYVDWTLCDFGNFIGYFISLDIFYSKFKNFKFVFKFICFYFILIHIVSTIQMCFKFQQVRFRHDVNPSYLQPIRLPISHLWTQKGACYQRHTIVLTQ